MDVSTTSRRARERISVVNVKVLLGVMSYKTTSSARRPHRAARLRTASFKTGSDPSLVTELGSQGIVAGGREGCSGVGVNLMNNGAGGMVDM